MVRDLQARRLPHAVVLERWPPPTLEKEKENLQNVPNGRQLGQAGGGAGRARASLRDLIQGARAPYCPHGLPGAAGWARPRELPALGRRGLLGSHGPKAPFQGRCGRGGRGLGPPSTPLQAAQDGPEGWEKPPGRLGRTSEFRGQPSPPAGRAWEPRSLGCACRHDGPGHCGRTCWEVGRARTGRFVPLHARPSWPKEARLAPKASEKRCRGARLLGRSFLDRQTLARPGTGDPASAPLRGQPGLHAATTRRGGTAWPARCRSPGSWGARPPHLSVSRRQATSYRPQPRPPGPLGPAHTRPYVRAPRRTPKKA
jgi:hypothetical protein